MKRKGASMEDAWDVEIVVDARGNSAVVPVVGDVVIELGGGVEMGGEDDANEMTGVVGLELIVVGVDEVVGLIVPVMMKEAIPV